MGRASIVRRHERAASQRADGVRWDRLEAGRARDVRFSAVRIEPGGQAGARFAQHEGREYGIVLAGQLTVELGFEAYHLDPGDSIAFDATTPHRLTNRADEPAVAVWLELDGSAVERLMGDAPYADARAGAHDVDARADAHCVDAQVGARHVMAERR